MVEECAALGGVSRREFLALGAGAGAGLVMAGCGAAGDSSEVGEIAGRGGSGYSGPKVSLDSGTDSWVGTDR